MRNFKIILYTLAIAIVALTLFCSVFSLPIGKGATMLSHGIALFYLVKEFIKLDKNGPN